MHTSLGPAEIQAYRTTLRRQSLQARESLSAAEHALLSARIERNLRAQLQTQAPSCVAFCWPYRAEFDARPLVRDLLAEGWRACLPVVGDEVGPMHFRAWTPQTPMQADRHGIQTPSEGEEMVPDLILLPFNAIDACGYRLGYGAGYFDRTLAAMQPRPYVIGVGFSVGVVASVCPQPHDIPVNCRITETGVCRF
ncbi:MAG TPA: 5-formyltetrahydrofolate cyclo-ligase [Rhodocyclaceae bacterium]|jgi:5,10-methenyltetrahydrofolate synthetase